MESFAIKVRYGSGHHFDPMLNETINRVSREVPMYDVEMAELKVEALAKTN